MLTVGSLFSGIGGIELGLERIGKFRTIWQCEIAGYPSAVLAERFPNIPNLGDITKVDWNGIEKPDVICGGFPCQDISIAGKGKGIVEGKRSGLWSEFAKCLRSLRPRYALIENVPMLAKRGLWLVLADLASLGYDAEWQIISAAQCGAPHRRERLFIIAYPHGERQRDRNDGQGIRDEQKYDMGEEGKEGRRLLPYAPERLEASYANKLGSDNGPVDGGRRPIQDASLRNVGKEEQERKRGQRYGYETIDASDARSVGIQDQPTGQVQGFPEFEVFQSIRRVEDLRGRPYIPEPLLRRTDDGLSSKLERYIWKERIKALGNAVVPACAEIAGRRIMEIEENAL